MSEISRVALFGKLNPLAYKAIEGATVFCKMRGNPYVELVHWLTRSCRRRTPTCTAIVRHYELDAVGAGARHDGRARPPAARRDRRSPTSPSTSRTRSSAAGSTARCMFGEAQVRTGYLLRRHAEDAAACATRCWRSRAVRADQGRRPGRRTSRRSVAGSPEAGPAARSDGSGMAGGAARRGQRRDGAGGDGQAGGAEEVRRRPDRAGARRARSIR